MPVQQTSPQQDDSAYDRSKGADSSFQEQLLRERAEDKQQVAALTFELNAMREETEMKKAVESGTKNRQRELAKRVAELWSVTECEPVDKLTFYSEVEALANPTPEVLGAYECEVERLTDMLPLMEAATRREFILERLHGLVNQNAAFARGNEQQLRQRQEFIRELQRLNEQLAQALPAYEKKYTRVFYYRGMPYLEQIHKGVQDTVNRDMVRAKSPSKVSSREMVARLPHQGQSPRGLSSEAQETINHSDYYHIWTHNPRFSSLLQETINEARFHRALGERALTQRDYASRSLSARSAQVWR